MGIRLYFTLNPTRYKHKQVAEPLKNVDYEAIIGVCSAIWVSRAYISKLA
jgi:hypothetical protein